VLVERYSIPEVTESFYATVQKRSLPNQLLMELLKASAPDPSAAIDRA
jgi:hypothetical protein